MDMLQVLRAAQLRHEEFIGELEHLVNIDSGSSTPAGVNKVADLCQERLERGGWTVERLRGPRHPAAGQLGDLLIGRTQGRRDRDVLVIGHTDTIFEEGTVAQRPFEIRGTRAYGPGVADMKAGLLSAFFALEVLQETMPERTGNLTMVCNPDEELGSPFSGPLIRELARTHDLALVLEAGRENGDIVSSRKGVTDYSIHIVGRAAHAGVEPERGRSAAVEAAHKVLALHAINGRWPGVTVNVGVVRGGTRASVVAEHCDLEVDLRSPHLSSLQAAENEIESLCGRAHTEGVKISFVKGEWHRPMERSEGTARLVRLAQMIGRQVGIDLDEAATGGASDANTTSAEGTPTLDGLGPVGGDDHSPSEWVDLESVAPRIALLAGLIGQG